ncbi:hypothetical protein KI387_013821, partial [Taxus chinensis]
CNASKNKSRLTVFLLLTSITREPSSVPIAGYLLISKKPYHHDRSNMPAQKCDDAFTNCMLDEVSVQKDKSMLGGGTKLSKEKCYKGKIFDQFGILSVLTGCQRPERTPSHPSCPQVNLQEPADPETSEKTVRIFTSNISVLFLCC